MAALLAWLLVAPTGVLLAQEEGDAPASRTGVTLPGSGYDAGWLHQQIFGHSYRELWTTPIDAPVLDLATFAGGLTPLTSGGGSQTRSLRFQGRDGRQYLFRLIDKDPSMALPAEYRGTVVSQVVRDQTSADDHSGDLSSTSAKNDNATVATSSGLSTCAACPALEIT